MACRVTIAAALCAVLGTLGAAPATAPSDSPSQGFATPGLSARDDTAYGGGSPIDDCVTALDSYEGEIIAVVKGETVVRIGQPSPGTVIGNATGSGPGGYPPICDVQSAVGKLIVAGALTEIDGQPFARLAAWNGQAWGPLGTGVNGPVAALAVFRDRLIAGGEFTEAGGVRARHVARWDGAGWSPLGPGLDGVIRHFTVWDNKLIADVVADDRSGLYAWDGRSWSAIEMSGECLTEERRVSTLTAYGKRLIAGTLCNGCDGVSVCAWDGTCWSAAGELLSNSGPPLDQTGAWEMTVYDGTLVVGGAFWDPGPNLARWDGTQWSAVGSGTDGAVCALTVSRGCLYAGGLFTSADGESAGYLATWEDSVKTPQSLQVSMYQDAIYLHWMTPPDAGFRSTVVRYATDGFPSDPSQGTPLPNGAGGVFVRPPGAWDGFFHEGLTRGVAYYYSAFASYADSVYSRPATLLVTMDDYDPPYHLWRFTADAADRSAALSWQNSYDQDLKEAVIRYDTTGCPLCPTDGLPIPNENDGRFESAPWSDSTFVHLGLTNGVTYYYSAFAFDSSANYSDPKSASGTPRAMVRDFDAAAESLSVSLTWRNPPDSSFKETFICFAWDGYPDRPDRGTPLPNGNGGRFEGTPGGQGTFRHLGLIAGRTYCYSAFVCDSALNYSQPVQARARVRYVAPPVLSLWIDRIATTAQSISLYLGADAQLDTASSGIWVGGDPISGAPGDPHHWSWNPCLTGTNDSLPILVRASDVDGNHNWAKFTASVNSLSRNEAGFSQSPERRVRLEFDPEAVSEDTHIAILPCREPFEEGRWARIVPEGEPTWSFIITPRDAIAENSAYIIFDYGGSDLDSLGAPAALRIRLDDLGVIRSYTDPVAKIVSAQISRLGMFMLEMGSGYPDPFVDPDVLAVESPHPNPFAEATSLAFQIRASQQIKIAIYDVVGRRVLGLADACMRPGFHGVTWDGRDDRGDLSPSGVYFLRIENARKSSTSKVILLR